MILLFWLGQILQYEQLNEVNKMNKEKILRKVQKVIKGLDQTKDDLIEVSYLLDDMLVACVELEDMLEDSTIQDIE